MSKKYQKMQLLVHRDVTPPVKAQQNLVDSILDSMVDGNEYGSIVSLLPKPNFQALKSKPFDISS